jgi:class 3 adenylate cyclase
MSSRVLTIMFTDIKGFTERTSLSSREELDNILGEHEELLMPLLPDFGGRLVKTVGDALLVAFESPTNAVLCGIMMQDRLRGRNKDMPEGEHLEIRVAINTGEVLEREGDVFGDAVNIAARIEGITDASEIFFTESVYLAMNKAEVPSSEVGQRRLKGIPEPIKIYKVIQDRHSEAYTRLIRRLKDNAAQEANAPSAEIAVDGGGRGPGGLLALAGGVVLIAAVIVLAVVFGRGGSPATPPAPGGGEEPAPPPAEKKAPDPVLEAVAGVDKALADGNFGLGLARADALLKEHPGREESHGALRKVVKAEAEALLGDKKFEDALQLLEKRTATQNYVTFADLGKKIRLVWAAHWMERGHLGNAANQYGLLMKNHPKDLEIMRVVIRDMGAVKHSSLRSLASSAALRIAENTEGDLDAATGEALLLVFTRYDREHHYAKDAWEVLAARYPGALESLRKYLVSDHRITRMNAYHFLNEKNALTPEEELGVHVKNLLLLSATGGSDFKALTLSLAALEEASAMPDWEARRKAAKLEPFVKIRALRTSNDTTERLFSLLAKAFFPEVEGAVQNWIRGDDLVIRRAAFRIWKKAGLPEDFDLWAYQEGNLLLKDYAYSYRIFTEAVEYFRTMASTNRAEEAKQLLLAAKDRIEKGIEKVLEGPFKGQVRTYRLNLAKVEEALKDFQ